MLYFLSVSILLTLMPGPDIVFVMAQSISNGRKSGIYTGLGLCTGVIVHTMAAAFGISAILYNSTVAFQIMKYAGAIYLLYLAWQALREGKAMLSADEAPPAQSGGALFRKGILMNILNPKVSLFFLAFLPQFITPGTTNAPWQMIFLGLVFMVQAVVIFTLVAVFAGHVGQKVVGRPQLGRYVNLGKAALFACIGIRLALSEK